MSETRQPRIALLVRFESALSGDELQRRYRERMDQFRALPGLVQKHYIHDEATGEWGGLK